MRRLSKRIRWVLGVVIGLPLLAVGIIGFAHTKTGRPLLAYIPGMGKCPLGFGANLSPARRDAARKTALAPFKGKERAAARPALGFALDETSRHDIEQWASTHAVTCKSPDPSNTQLLCSDVPRGALTGAQHDSEEVRFGFDSADRLVSVRAATNRLGPTDAIASVVSAETQVGSAVGPATSTTGVRDPATLETPLAQASSSFRYSDYRAEISATNVGGSRVRVIEQYQAIPD